MLYLEKCPSSLTEGIGVISTLSNNIKIPWSNILTENEKKDVERLYFFRSGFKMIVKTANDISIETLANLIVTMYAGKWDKLWNDFNIEYNPLDAYKLTETGNRKIDKNGEDVRAYGKITEQQGSDTGTVGTTGTDNTNTDDSVYGFNSIDAVPSDKSVEVANTQSTETRNLSTTSNITNSGADTDITESEEIENYSYTKSGNIGYTTPQELIRQNIELWKDTFFDAVFSDIDKFMTIQVYN